MSLHMRFALRSGGPAVRAALIGLSAAVLLAGCATKRDLRDLREEVLRLQARQDSLFRETQRQNLMLLDTLRQSFSAQLDAQGQTSHRFRELEQQLARTEAMINQLHGLITQFNTRLDQAAAQQAANQSSNTTVGSSDVEALYVAGTESLRQGAYSTARLAFLQIVNQSPDDARAPDAQFQIGETYAQEGDFEKAIGELARVEERWPRSARAPAAVLRAAVIAQENLQDNSRARRLYDMVRMRYPDSEESREAARRLAAIGR
ncbi:MAG: tetratricopeptide repeat protein [Gemmatimonadetes bacterium]|nr:tetratricopeptide repeat protein [Gemmatimonadota bacterium]